LDHACTVKTLEPPWRDNAPRVSCVPSGTYQIALQPSEKTSQATNGRQRTAWFLQSVPNRSSVLIHPGNFESDTKGCILVGLAFETINGRPGLAKSGLAFAAMMQAFAAHMPTHLVIAWAEAQPMHNEISNH